MTQHTEADIQAGIQAGLQSISAFATADIVINEWGVLDGSTQNAPYVIITTADSMDSQQDAPMPNTRWDVPITLVEAFTDWPTTLGNLRDRRQAIVNEINSGNARSAGGLEAVSINDIRTNGPILPYYGPYVDPNNRPEGLPVYLMQELILACEVW